VDLRAAVIYLDRHQAAADAGLVDPEDGYAGVTGSRVDTGLDAIDLAVGYLLVFEPDDQRGVTSYHRPTPGEELTGSGRMAGHERGTVAVEREHSTSHGPRYCTIYCGGRKALVLRLGRFVDLRRVTPGRAGEPTADLPSTMFHASCGRTRVRGPFRPYPRVVCFHGFQSRPLRKHGLVGLLAYVKLGHLFTSLVMSWSGQPTPPSGTGSESLRYKPRPSGRGGWLSASLELEADRPPRMRGIRTSWDWNDSLQSQEVLSMICYFPTTQLLMVQLAAVQSMLVWPAILEQASRAVNT